MGSLSNHAENELLDHVLKVGSYSRPANLYVALCDGDPGEAGTGSTISEPSDAAYARQVCNDWEAAALLRATANSTAIAFPAATTAWGTMSWFAICDHLSTGNVIARGPITPNKTVAKDDVVEFAIGDLDISWNANGPSNYLAGALLDHVFADIPFSVPTSIFAAFTTIVVVDSDTGSTIAEPSGGSYARKEHNAWKTASGGISSNDGNIEFEKATGDWGTIKGKAQCDALTAGNVLFHAAVAVAKPVDNGDTAKILDGQFVCTLD